MRFRRKTRRISETIKDKDQVYFESLTENRILLFKLLTLNDRKNQYRNKNRSASSLATAGFLVTSGIGGVFYLYICLFLLSAFVFMVNKRVHKRNF